MKKLLLFSLLAVLGSCSEPNEPVDPRECFKDQEGNIFVDNLTKNPYKVFVNGTYEKIVPASSHILIPVRFDKDIPIRVEQENGSDKKSGSVTVEVCGETLFRFQ